MEAVGAVRIRRDVVQGGRVQSRDRSERQRLLQRYLELVEELRKAVRVVVGAVEAQPRLELVEVVDKVPEAGLARELKRSVSVSPAQSKRVWTHDRGVVRVELARAALVQNVGAILDRPLRARRLGAVTVAEHLEPSFLQSSFC